MKLDFGLLETFASYLPDYPWSPSHLPSDRASTPFEMPLTAAGTSAAGAAASAAKGEDQLRIEMLGAGNEVGRSCCVLTYKGELVIRLAGSLKYRELTLGSLTLISFQGRPLYAMLESIRRIAESPLSPSSTSSIGVQSMLCSSLSE